MRQYLIKSAEQGRRAIDDGAQWLTLASPTPEAICELIPLCNEAGIILVIEGNTDMALNTLVGEIRVSGTCISAADGNPAEIREKLGPHAILGYSATSAAEIAELAKLDIDYFTLPTSEMTAELAEIETPVVATGANETPEGFAGFLA